LSQRLFSHQCALRRVGAAQQAGLGGLELLLRGRQRRTQRACLNHHPHRPLLLARQLGQLLGHHHVLRLQHLDVRRRRHELGLRAGGCLPFGFECRSGDAQLLHGVVARGLKPLQSGRQGCRFLGRRRELALQCRDLGKKHEPPPV
jgi:hypothetical protein